MENNEKYPIAKLLGSYFIVLLLIILIALMGSCGTRKAESEKQKTSTSHTIEGSTDLSKDSKSIFTTQEEALRTINKSNQTTETTITKEYDNVTGNLVKSTEATKTGNEIDKSTYYTKTIRKNTLHEVLKLKIQYIDKTTVKTLYKTKTVTSNRNGLYFLGAFAVLIGGILVWLKWIR